MIDKNVLRQLEPVANRLRQARMMTSMAVVWFAAAAIGLLLLWGMRAGVGVASAVYWGLIPAALLVAGVAAWMSLRSARDYRQLAWKIEAVYPDLNTSLITAVHQHPGESGHYSYLQQEVIRSVALHSYRKPWNRLVPTSRLAAAHIANLLGLLSLAVVMVALLLLAPAAAEALPGHAFNDVAVTTNPSYSVTIEPGHTEVEKGTSLLVLARFQGLLPAEATLVYQTNSAEAELQQTGMSKSLDDPVFGGRIPSVDMPLTYHVQYGEQASDPYQVTVFEYPRLLRADAHLNYPSYTQLEPKLVQDVRRVSAVEGTQVTLQCQLNKSVASALLRDRQGNEVPLVATTGEFQYEAKLQLTESTRWELHLIDEAGRSNASPPEFVLNALPNRVPDLKIVFPARDMQVSPIEELDLSATAWDDYGLDRIGLTYAQAGSSQQEVVLSTQQPAQETVSLEHMLSLESLQAEPDQLISYYFWAEDRGPTGEVRRTYSDMFFAEVRPFEEIFRQGQQPTESQMQQQQQGQQQSPAGQKAEELAELQKQIINGTWKVIRRETRDQPTVNFAPDVQLLHDSQNSALQQASELAGEIQDPESLQHVEQVKQSMQQAATLLNQAHSQAEPAELQSALQAQQAAYQALLRLRAREHEVVQSNQQQGQSSSQSSSQSSRSQQQLQQLELQDDENRYETEQAAQAQQDDAAEREDRQVLNRLRELAQRQNDLNERIKEMQSALQEARTEAERDEIERQLKRLREEQQQLLRDTEELQQRMEQPENQQRMSEQRDQLQQARENARQASEALEQGMISRAAAEGTRAESELRDLQEEFQRRTAKGFSDEVRQMQKQASELQENEQQLAEELDNIDQEPDQPSLRETDQREQATEAVQQQRERAEELLERMRQTVEEAEETEPLLAEELYDSIRQSRQQSLEQALEATQQSLQRGLVDDARNREQQAAEAISQLREGIDRAAQSVLGDETEALRRAEQELNQLDEELNQEIDQAQGGSREDRTGQPADREGERSPSEANGQEQQASQEAASGQPQPDGEPTGGETPAEPSGEGEPAANQPQNAAPGENQPSEQEANQQSSQSQPGTPGNQAGQRRSQEQTSPEGQPRPGQAGQPPSNNPGTSSAGGAGLLDQFLQRGEQQPAAPLTGDDFLDWSDRLRDVEEILTDPDLRAEAARIRDRAKSIRKEVKRNSKEPNWEIVQDMVAEPLEQLRNRVSEQLLRRTSEEARIPLDRDPVPGKYQEQVRRYYERLGRGQ